MKLFTPAQIKEWDRVTISRKGITSLELMEKAGQLCASFILSNYPHCEEFHMLCGKGNNGGDGLVIARHLEQKGRTCRVYVSSGDGTAEQQQNLAAYRHMGNLVYSFEDFLNSTFSPSSILIDALFGSGLSSPIKGDYKQIVDAVNRLNLFKIAIDIPSGMPSGQEVFSGDEYAFVKADHTLSIQNYKLPFFVDSYRNGAGKISLVDIGLDPEFERETEAGFEYADTAFIRSFYKNRNQLAHKGNNGHLLIAGGSKPTAGAVLLASRAALKSGAGLCSVCLPESILPSLNSYLPEAMYSEGAGHHFLTGFPEETMRFNSAVIGPGLGKEQDTARALFSFLEKVHFPCLIDADALNIVSESGRTELLKGHIITPHPGEFDRLFGKHTGTDRIQTAISKSKELLCVIVLKGPNTFVAGSDGRKTFNSTGNASLAKGGSGDVLSGCIGALLAQGYQPFEAAVLGVYVHGRAADLSLEEMGVESLLAGELCDFLGKTFKELNGSEK